MPVLRGLMEADPAAVLLFHDLSDVLFQLPPSELMRRFLARGLPTAFGAEVLCWPETDFCLVRPPPYVPDSVVESGTPTLFPNGGFYLGTVEALYRILHGCYWQKVDAMFRGLPLPSE